jgi:predicted  nucleic acid-binding Zn-ribbon protein
MNVRECKKCGMNFGLKSTLDPRKLCPECSTRRFNRYNQVVKRADDLVTREEEYLKKLSDLEEQIEVTLETKLSEFMLDMEVKVFGMIEEKMSNKVMTIHTRTVRLDEKLENLEKVNRELRRQLSRIQNRGEKK